MKKRPVEDLISRIKNYPNTKHFLEAPMKKLALILAFLIIPCAAFGLEMLDDNSMDKVTGQAGVHIAFDDVQIFINIDKMAWIDCDGLDGPGCNSDGGAIALNNFQIDVLNINAIVDTVTVDTSAVNTTNQTSGTAALQLYSVECGAIPLFYDYGQTGNGACYLNSAVLNTAGLDNYTTISSLSVFKAQAVSIDVADELPALSQGMTNNAAGSAVAIGGVYIGLPTAEIYINSMSFTPVYDGDINNQTSAAINDDNTTAALATSFGTTNASFGTIYLEGVTFSILSGWMEIAPH